MRKIPVYYQKFIVDLKDCRHGDWVYDDEGRLCFVEVRPGDGEHGPCYSLHSYGIETWCPGNTAVFPLSLATMAIARDMEAHRDKYHRAGIMNPAFSRELREEFINLMLVDDEADDCREQYRAIWGRMNARLEERLRSAEVLHINRKGN